MTNPTLSGQVPDALPAIQRFEVVDCIDSKHVPAVIPNPHGPWVRYEDHAAALCRLHAENEALRAQQDDAYDHGPQAETVEEAARDVGKWLNERPNRPLDLRHVAMLTHHAKRTAHVQNPAEIEHVAGDVVKNGAEVNMSTQQPAPAGAAPECLTCNDHGAVGNILTAEPCPDCTRWNSQPAPATPITVEQVEDAIGLQSSAWDTIGAEKIVEAVLRLANAAPATQQAGVVIDLIGKLVQAESNKTRTHQEYMGKAMPDDVYARFQRLRDETIPALRTQLLDALATRQAGAEE